MEWNELWKRRYMNCDNNAMPSANPNSSIIKENVFSFNDEMNRIAVAQAVQPVNKILKKSEK